MKKILCMFLAIMMLMGLCGCFGGGGSEDVRGDIIPGGTTAGTTEGTTEPEPEFSLGKAANNTYKNDFLGLSCTLPAQWVFYSDEQILEMNNLVGDYLEEEIAEQLQNATIIYDMYAVEEATGCNVNVNLEKLNALQALSMNLKATLEAQIDAIYSVYQNMGYTDVQVTYEKVTVDGKEFDGLRVNAKIAEFEFCSVAFAFRKGNYLANITVSALSADGVDAILQCFTVE